MPKLGWIGIDVGGTKTRFDLFDEGFRVVHSIRVKTKKEVEDFKSELTKTVNKLVKMATPRLIISGIGVGFAGPVNTNKGMVQSAPNLPALAGFSFKKALAPFSSGDVTVYNDVHAAMYGELKLGAAGGCKNV